VVCVGAYLIFRADSNAPTAVWTDGVSVFDRPGGTNVPRSCVGSRPASQAVHRAPALVGCVSWTDALKATIAVGRWVDRNELVIEFAPAEGTDVVDANGVTWWRCDLPK